jgi:hypothetical protein
MREEMKSRNEIDRKESRVAGKRYQDWEGHLSSGIFFRVFKN